jgi:phthalate 4,5-dioxygenase reductase subunit
MTEALNPELVLQLRVQGAEFVGADIRQIEFVDPEGGELPEFTPGAHLLIQAPNGSTRRYSLTNAPSERQHYVIAVKREANGPRRLDPGVVDGIQAGDLVHVSMPRNEFELKANASASCSSPEVSASRRSAR